MDGGHTCGWWAHVCPVFSGSSLSVNPEPSHVGQPRRAMCRCVPPSGSWPLIRTSAGLTTLARAPRFPPEVYVPLMTEVCRGEWGISESSPLQARNGAEVSRAISYTQNHFLLCLAQKKDVSFFMLVPKAHDVPSTESQVFRASQ